MAIVLITGGSGLIGRALTHALVLEGHSVRWLTRGATEPPSFRWDIEHGFVDVAALKDVDHIVHLSGAGIADKRWTAARMKELHASRGGAARLLLRAVRDHGAHPKSFISASGIGFYGAITSDHIFEENDPSFDDPIGRLTRDWEDAADEWSATCRVVKLRTPMVLARDGGAIPKLTAPARWGLAVAFGSGRQWMPWVHIDDLVRAYAMAINNERMHGAYNVVATEQPMNREFMKELAKALNSPYILPNLPGFVLRLVFGELSGVLLEGSRASRERLDRAGFQFGHERLGETLRSLLQ